MKLLTFFALSLCILVQGSFISLPTPNSNITPNGALLVQVVNPISHQGSVEVAMVIGLLQCQQDPCPESSALGKAVFTGQYNPQLHEKPGNPYQNFTVTVPDFQTNFGTNKAKLTVARFHLLAAGPSPELEINRVFLNIVFPS